MIQRLTGFLRSPIFTLVAAGSLAWAVFVVTAFVNENLTHLRVLPADPNPNAIAADDVSPNLKTLYPLIANNTTATPKDADDTIDINRAFITPPKVQPVAATPDYFKALKDNHVLHLVALTDTGAIIDGQFYAFGATLERYAYPSGGAGSKARAPRLAKGPTPGTVLIKENPGQRNFILE